MRTQISSTVPVNTYRLDGIVITDYEVEVRVIDDSADPNRIAIVEAAKIAARSSLGAPVTIDRVISADFEPVFGNSYYVTLAAQTARKG